MWHRSKFLTEISGEISSRTNLPKWASRSYKTSYRLSQTRTSGTSVPSRRSATGSPSRRMLETLWTCLLYTSDAADDLLCVDLGGRRIIKKKKKKQKQQDKK